MTRTERTYYLVFGLYNVSWSAIGPMYALFLLGRGLDLLEINLVLATYLITAFLFEVPTGAVADVFGRKVSFLLSCVVRAAAFALYSVSDSFAEFLFAEFIDAVGTTLATGALDAWAVDGMRGEGDERPADRFFARAHILARLSMILSGLLGGYLATIGMRGPWLLGSACFTLTAVLGALLMREPPRSRSSDGRRPSLRATLAHGLRTVRVSPLLRRLCLLTLVASFAVMPAYHLWQPRLQGLTQEGVWVMGWAWALLNLANVAGGVLVARLDGRFARERILGMVALWRSATLAAAALATAFFPALGAILLWEIGFGLSEPLVQAWMNEHVDSAERATVLSVRSMAFTLGGAVGLVCLGLVARSEGIPTAWLCAAAVLAATFVGYLGLGGMGSAKPAAVRHTAAA
jgi:MFS family permease